MQLKKMREEIVPGTKSVIESAGESCVYNCEMPLRYGLPCKCWLYSCIVNFIPIPISLIHPRWFIDPSFVISWRMTLDYGLNFEHMRCLAEGIIGPGNTDLTVGIGLSRRRNRSQKKRELDWSVFTMGSGLELHVFLSRAFLLYLYFPVLGS